MDKRAEKPGNLHDVDHAYRDMDMRTAAYFLYFGEVKTTTFLNDTEFLNRTFRSF